MEAVMSEWIKDFVVALCVFFFGGVAFLGSVFGVVWASLSAAAWAGFPPVAGVLGALSFIGAALLAAGFASRDRRLDRV
jgi:hypothetical protein